MNPAIIWGVIFFILIAVEMMTGTFYLLMISIGALAGAVAALIGLDALWQIGISGVVAAFATGICHFKIVRHRKSPIYSENKNTIIDIGEFVEVTHWSHNKTTQVRYRGAEWSAIWAGKEAPVIGNCIILGMQGNQLLLDMPKHS